MYPDADVVTPRKHWCTKAEREYMFYGDHGKKYKFDLVIHARSEVKFKRHGRNHTPSKYVKLLKKLRTHGDISACSIGT